MDEQKLTAKDVAKYFRVSETTIRRWVKAGRIVGFKIGRDWRFERSVLNTFSQ